MNKVLLVKTTTKPFSYGEQISSSDIYIGDEFSRRSCLLGIASLSAVLKKNGHKVRFFDTDLDSKEDYQSLITSFEPDLIGFYSIICGLIDVPGLIRTSKEIKNDVKTIAGGPHIEYLEEKTLNLLGVDYAVYGEAENVVLEVANSVKENRAVKAIPGLIYKNTSHGPGLVNDLTKLPVPDWDLFFGDEVEKDKYLRYALTETARGCDYRCPFCSLHKTFPTRRIKSKDGFKKEMDLLADLGVKHLVFVEPALYPAKHVRDLSKLLSNYDIKAWSGYGKPGTLSLDDLKTMNESGCVSLFWGGESGKKATQEAYGKPSLSTLLKQEDKAKKSGINSMWSFMICNPGETAQDQQLTYDFILKLNPPMVKLNPFVPLPNSDMHLNADEWGLTFTSNDWVKEMHVTYRKLSKMTSSGSQAQKNRLKKSLSTSDGQERFRQLINSLKYLKFFKTKEGLSYTDGLFYTVVFNLKLRNETRIDPDITNYELTGGLSTGIKLSEILKQHW